MMFNKYRIKLKYTTFFYYNEKDENYISNLKYFGFPYKKDDYCLMNENVKSGNIAINKTKIKQMLKKANLKFVKIEDGYWKGQNKNNSKKEYQDILVFKKD